MKRSEINRAIKQAIAFARTHKFNLPPFAFWTPKDWQKKGREADEIRDCMLGWDITDFACGDFKKFGLVLFTIRNGKHRDRRYPKPYAEKMMIVTEGQITPMHFHWQKSEDIINRGGGNLVIQLYNSTPSEKLARSNVTASVNGVLKTVKAGGIVTLAPGESISLPRGLYHKFWGQEGAGRVLVGEVSMVNDDKRDNRFLDPLGRFPAIGEDEPAQYLLCNEYPRAR